MFPRIDRPCPYADRLASVMDGDFCRMCKCTVFDLDAMAPRERRTFLKRTRDEDTCVTYRVKPALAAMALVAAMTAASPAMAQDFSEEEPGIIVSAGRLPRLNIAAAPVQTVRPADVRPNRERPRRKPRRATPASEPVVTVLAGRVARTD